MEKSFNQRGHVTKFYTSFSHSNHDDTTHTTDDVLHTVSKTLDSIDKPWLFIGHVNFINFTRYGMQELPLYVNLVREPVSCFVSLYYFLRFKHPRPMSDERRNMTFDECVLSRDPECAALRNITRFVPFFCGHDDYCLDNPSLGLSVAKRNIEQHYSVIGYLESVGEFYEALEFMMPHYFQGIYARYRRQGADRERISQGKKKVDPSPEAVEEFQRRIQHELDLYYFIKQRFDCLMRRIREMQSENKS